MTDNLPVEFLIGMDILGVFKSIQIAEEGHDLIVTTVLPDIVQDNLDLFDKPLAEACLKGIKPEEIIQLVPNAKPRRPFSSHEWQALKLQIPELQKQGVIEKSRSPWRHAPVIVPKQGGGVRIAINYKPVNEFTIFDAYPIPRMDDLLLKCADAKLFSSLDFSQCYHQLPLAEQDKEKTAFYALGELWQFRRCPFGLKTAVTN